MKLQESGENYLETILMLKNEKGYVRSIDVAHALSFTKPSVSRAMSVLKKAGHIVFDEDGGIELTASGRQIAEQIYERHRLLTDYLKAIGVSDETAAADACRIEHVISQETFERLKAHAAPHIN
ncbi:MAG: metal-dependent transcriptional regulator [Clostridiales bacterium]|jgi:DtxR family Mn-dependent transcriptional regulator|nr:metal-dependent transcriptional regulator [Clostridiales bacterium]